MSGWLTKTKTAIIVYLNILETRRFEVKLRRFLRGWKFTEKQIDAAVYAVLNVANEE